VIGDAWFVTTLSAWTYWVTITDGTNTVSLQNNLKHDPPGTGLLDLDHTASVSLAVFTDPCVPLEVTIIIAGSLDTGFFKDDLEFTLEIT
jgi:hypothetical protein